MLRPRILDVLRSRVGVTGRGDLAVPVASQLTTPSPGNQLLARARLWSAAAATQASVTDEVQSPFSFRAFRAIKAEMGIDRLGLWRGGMVRYAEVRGELGSVGDREFLECVGEVGFDGPWRDVETLGDFTIAVSGGC